MHEEKKLFEETKKGCSWRSKTFLEYPLSQCWYLFLKEMDKIMINKYKDIDCYCTCTCTCWTINRQIVLQVYPLYQIMIQSRDFRHPFATDGGRTCWTRNRRRLSPLTHRTADSGQLYKMTVNKWWKFLLPELRGKMWVFTKTYCDLFLIVIENE